MALSPKPKCKRQQEGKLSKLRRTILILTKCRSIRDHKAIFCVCIMVKAPSILRNNCHHEVARIKWSEKKTQDKIGNSQKNSTTK